MLCEMRGCDGNMSGWHGSHGSSGSSRGMCVFRKMEIGAYVVNSNQVSSYDNYYQGENDPDTVFTGYEYGQQGFPDSRRHELRASKTYVSQHVRQGHQQKQAEQPILRERCQQNLGNASNRRMTMIETSSGSHPQWQNSSENCLITTRETETNRSRDGSVAGNIYQGPIVRVQVPEAYYEGGSAKGSETAAAYKQNMSYNVDGERMDQHLQRVREMDEIYSGPVSAETYGRINEWLKNCQQHSSRSFKSGHVSYGPNHSGTEKKLKQNTTSCYVSKPDDRMHNQPGNNSNLKLSKEPRVVAALEPKATKPGNVLQPNHQQRHQNTDWTKKREVPFHQSSAPRSNNVTSAFSSNDNYVANVTNPYFESDLCNTSSDWSSETLSIIGSDKSSYCTDFTPFELGYADTPSEIYRKDSESTSASECPTEVEKNFSISHVIVSDRMQTKNAAYQKNFSETLHDSFGNEFVCNRRNDSSVLNSVRNTNFEPNSKQQQLQDMVTDKVPKNPRIIEAALQTSKTAHVASVFVGDSQRTLWANPDFDNVTKPSSGKQNHCRYKKPTADPVSSAEAVQNLKIFEKRVYQEDRKSLQVPSEAKLYTSDRKPMIPLRCVSLECPLSSQFTEKNQPFSTQVHNNCYKEPSNEKDSALLKQLESRQVPQMRSGSLSITIRPSRLTVMDYFKKIDDVWDSSGRKEEPEMKETAELLSDNELIQEIADDTAMDAKALEINGVDDLNFGSSADISDESEELDEFTKTVIKADISERALHSSSKTEFFSKPQYSALKQSKFLKTDASSLLADMQSRFAGKVYQMLDDTKTQSEDQKNKDFKEQSNFEDNTILHSGPSFLVSQRQLQESRSSLLPRKFTDSPDRSFQMKLSKNAVPVNCAFGCNSEYIKCKHEDLSDTNFRSSSEKKRSDMYLPASENVSKTNCPEFQSFIKNHSDSHIFRSDASVTPNGSTARMAPVFDKLYTDDRSHVEMISPRSLPLETASDVISDHLGSESMQLTGNKVKATAEEFIEEDRFLMSLLQQRTPDIPEFGSFCTPQLQPRNPVRTSHFTIRSPYGENSEQLPLISCTDEFGKEIASESTMKSPETFEVSHLQKEEPSGLDLKLLAYGIYESPKESAGEHCEEYHQWKSQETECSGKMLKHSPDSPSSVFKEGTAVLAAFPQRWSQNSDSMTHEGVDNELQGRDHCSKMSKNPAGTSFSKTDTTKNSEAMSCQEFIDFPTLVINPPEPFSDFTIVL